jgi:hypothetical protein
VIKHIIMRRISRVVASSARGSALNKSRCTAAVFSRGYAAPNTPQTDFKVTDSGIRVYAHGVEHDMNFLGDLPAESKEVLSGKEWVPQTVSDFASRWEKDAPELAQQARELESLVDKFERAPVQFGKSEAYLRDIAVQTALERASARDVSPVEVALAHFWTAYSEVPSGGKLNEAAPTQLQRVKALLQNQRDPELNLQDARARKTAAIVKYIQAKSADEKAAAAAILLGSEKAQALKAALQGVNDAAKKEQIVKQHLQWDEATQAAAQLTQRHPEFSELKEVLAHFPPLVHHIGEPSRVQYRFKHATDKAYQRWLQNNSLTSPDEVAEKDPLLKNLRELLVSGKSQNAAVDAKKAQALQRAFPGLLFSRDITSFSSFLKKDEEVKSQLGDLYEDSIKEYPNDPALTIHKDLDQRIQLWNKHAQEVADVQQKWIDAKIAFIDAKIQEGMVQMDKFVNGTVDDILADHPEWEKEIEDDIANHRWDPETEKKDYDHALQHYYEHHTTHA